MVKMNNRYKTIRELANILRYKEGEYYIPDELEFGIQVPVEVKLEDLKKEHKNLIEKYQRRKK